MTLTKQEIINTLTASFPDLPKNKALETIETLLEIIKRTLEDGEDVLVSGFGKFQVKDKDKRRGRNPATGKDLILKERRVVTFKCSGKLRKKVNTEPEQKKVKKTKHLLKNFDN